MADRLGRRFMMAMFSAWLADALLQTGELDRAIEVARRAVRLASERNEPWARPVALRVVGQALGLSSSDGCQPVDRIPRHAPELDRKSAVEGKSGSGRVGCGGGRPFTKK